MMETIKRYVLPLIFILIIGNAFGQDEFYTEKDKRKVEEKEQVTNSGGISKPSIDQYYTETDYKLKFETNVFQDVELNQDDYHDKNEDHECKTNKCCRGGGGIIIDVAIELAVEVVLQSVIVLLTFWQ